MRAAHVAEMDVASFIAHLGRLDIAAIRLTAAETNADLDTLEQFDERAGRVVAAAFGIRLAGTAAVIRIAPAVIQAVLERCGE